MCPEDEMWPERQRITAFLRTADDLSCVRAACIVLSGCESVKTKRILNGNLCDCRHLKISCCSSCAGCSRAFVSVSETFSVWPCLVEGQSLQFVRVMLLLNTCRDVH